MSSRFIKKFEVLLEQGPEEMDDQAVFKSSLENPDAVESEIASIPNPQDNIQLITLANDYSDKIANKILPLLRKLHDELVQGKFNALNVKINGIAKINEDLAALAESLKGRVKDSVNSANKDQSKQ